MGLIGVVIGMVVMIHANQMEARGEDLRHFKTYMRIAYVVYLLATALGIWVYIALYG